MTNDRPGSAAKPGAAVVYQGVGDLRPDRLGRGVGPVACHRQKRAVSAPVVQQPAALERAANRQASWKRRRWLQVISHAPP